MLAQAVFLSDKQCIIHLTSVQRFSRTSCERTTGVPLLRPPRDKPLQVASSLFRSYPSTSYKTVMALLRDKAKIGLKSGVYSSSRGLVCSRGLGCHVKLGVLYIRAQALFSRLRTVLGDRRPVGLICFFLVTGRFTWSYLYYGLKPDGLENGWVQHCSTSIFLRFLVLNLSLAFSVPVLSHHAYKGGSAAAG